MKPKLSHLLAGAALGLGARALFPRLLLLKFKPDVAKLNAGDYKPLLGAYADDFVLHFNEGPHRWSGDWVGKPAFDRFLQNFTANPVETTLRIRALQDLSHGMDTDLLMLLAKATSRAKAGGELEDGLRDLLGPVGRGGGEAA